MTITPTIDYGRIHVTTLTEWVAEGLGDFVDDYNVPVIVAEVRAEIQTMLPDGVEILSEGQMYGPSPRIEFCNDDILDDVDLMTISERHEILH